MTSTTSKSTSSMFWKGFFDGAPFLLVICPFAVLFGVLATEAGLNVLETLAFSVVVIAGAAQFTALQLMAEDVPTLIILASSLAVNLRMMMYSASLTPWIGAAPLWQRALVAYFTVDQTYACAIAQYEKKPAMTLRQRLAYFAGAATPVCPLWYIFTAVGAMIGSQIPESFALDFALPITFLALVTPMMRSAAHVIAALTAVFVSLLVVDVPYSLGLMIAGIAGMVAGAQSEVFFQRRGLLRD